MRNDTGSRGIGFAFCDSTPDISHHAAGSRVASRAETAPRGTIARGATASTTASVAASASASATASTRTNAPITSTHTRTSTKTPRTPLEGTAVSTTRQATDRQGARP